MKSTNKTLLILGLACVFTTPIFTSHALADEITQSSSTLSNHLETESSITESSATTSASDSTIISTENPATSTTDTPVYDDLSTLNVKDVTVGQNTEFKNEQIFDSGTDSTGTPLQVDDLTITGIVDITKIGTYELKVTNGTLEKTVKVTVEPNLTALNVKNISIIQNSSFTNDMIFDSATDNLGNKITLADLKITGTVDTSKAGNYNLTIVNGSITKTVTVTVKSDLTTLNVKNVSLTQGSSFNYASFFVSATDVDGEALKVTDLKVTGSVTTGKIGTYTLTITNGIHVKKVTVTVTAIPIKKVAVYRMYNPNSYEHFYTKDYYERSVLVKRGWTCEGTAWYAPDRGNAIYRLYLGTVGEHFYSTSLYEKNILVSRGWKYEGIAFYSGGTVKTYRTYNSGIRKHNFTTDSYEQKVLTTQRGWKNEGVAWYVYQIGDKNGAEVGNHVIKNGINYYKGILIVNKKNSLPSNYNPGENSSAGKAIRNLISDMRNVGLNISNSYSGFRSYSYQSQLYNNYVVADGKKAADRYSARPGYSEHQTGLAFDLLNKTGQLVQSNLEVNWINSNAWRYGFIVRYLASKENITGYMQEQWHLRYVGSASLAKSIKDSGKTLEEYVGALGGGY